MGEIKFIAGLILASLFAIAIVSYVTNFGSDNNVAVDLNDEEEFSTLSSSLDDNVKLYHTQTNSSSKAFFSSEISTGDETTRTGGQFKVGMGSLITAITSVLSIASKKIFGGSIAFGIVITALVSFLVYAGTRYIWKTWKGGSPD